MWFSSSLAIPSICIACLHVQVRHPGVSGIMHRDFVLMQRTAALCSRLPGLAELRLEESIRQFGGPLKEQVRAEEEEPFPAVPPALSSLFPSYSPAVLNPHLTSFHQHTLPHPFPLICPVPPLLAGPGC